MKITKILIATFLLGSLFLAGCNKTDEAVTEPSDTAEAERAEFEEMTEEEKMQEMIKLIEAEEAKMEADEGTE